MILDKEGRTMGTQKKKGKDGPCKGAPCGKTDKHGRCKRCGAKRK